MSKNEHLDEDHVPSNKNGLGGKEDKWTFFSASQNLVSVLNDPSISRSYSDTIFTKDWGSSFADCPASQFVTFPSINSAHFENYLRHVQKRNRCIRKYMLLNKVKTSNKKKLSTTLDAVPQIFLANDFSLEDSSTFLAVLSLNGRTGPSSGDHKGGINVANVRDLQKSMSDYLDIVEDHLSSQISVRFQDFFQVMEAMNDVMGQISSTIKEVTQVRGKCTLLSNTLVKPTMTNLQSYKLRLNAEECYYKINLMSTIYQNHALFHGQMNAKDYVGALNLFDTSRKYLETELKGIKCFRHLDSEICEKEKLICSLMNEDYCKFLTNEWHRPLDTNASKYTVSEDEALSSIISGLLRLNKFNFIEKFTEEACAAITSATKQVLIEALSKRDDIDVSNREDALFEQTCRLDYGTWVELIQQLFDRLFLLLKRVQAVHSVILKATDRFTDSASGVGVPAELVNIKCQAANECLGSICDFAHSRCGSLIERKVNDGSLDRLSSNEFTEFSSLIETFVMRCEKISARRSPALKLILQIQSNKFATRFHEERRKKLISLLDIEQWKSVDKVPAEFQGLVTQIIEGADISEIRRNRAVAAEKTSQFVMINTEKFVVVNTAMVFVNMIFEYCQTSSEVNPLAADLLTRLLELLKQFSYRTQALVLRGEAVQVAGLKCITARNLANSARSLQLVIRLLPAVKEHFSNVLKKKYISMTTHFEEIIAMYKEHCDKVTEKMLNMVKEQMLGYLGKWEARPPVPSPQFQAVIQYLGVLHGNLEDCLPLNAFLDFFRNTHQIFIEILRSHLIRLKIMKDGGPQHG